MYINSKINWNSCLKSVIVSCYYEIENKRPSECFIDWIKNFLYIQSPKVIYTDIKTLNNVFKTIKECSEKIVEISPGIFFCNENTVFIIQNLENTFIWKHYKSLMEFSETIDKEKQSGINHNKYLYTIWNNKSFFLKDTSLYINAECYYWSDIGCIRYKSTPEIQKLVSSLNFAKNIINNTKITLSLICQYANTDEQYVNGIPYIYYNNSKIDRIQGGFFGGGKNEILEWCNLYIEQLEQFKKYKLFAGKDQYIMGCIYLKYKYKFNTIQPYLFNITEEMLRQQPNLKLGEDPWFRYLVIFN
jgi:hypothetical protein